MTPFAPEPCPPNLSAQIDQVCDQFESAAQAGKWPRIEDLVAEFPAPGRTNLLVELVAIEIDLRRRRGEAVDVSEYRRRFPEAATILHELAAEAQRGASEQRHRDPFTGPVDAYAETITLPGAPRRRIKHFELLSIVGEGGFGTVWRAKDTILQRDVAVKLPRKDRLQWTNLALFLREARAAATLRHPNIVAIHEVGEDDSSAFIVSDYVEGFSLKAFLKQSRMRSAEAAILVGKLAVAAHHAHEHGIVHRDLKPANVLMDRRGEPYIADFGLAKRVATDDSLAVPEQLVGTPAYMAPEQARADHGAIDRRTDVYALGVILYELLTGRTVFSGEPAYLLHQIQHDSPVPPRQINPGVPRDLEAICLKCLAKDRDQRYQTAQDLADDLHCFIGGETLQGIPAPLPYRVQKWFWRHRQALVAALAIAVVVGSLAGLSAWSLHPPEAPGDFRTVHLTTDPPGCEITLVAIDPDTGEPDPTKIQDAKRVTPLTMLLAPGHYLVVAVLPGESRFHEVSRYVPTPWDTFVSNKSGMGTPRHSNDNWTVREVSGEVDLRPIRIPGVDVTVGMGFVPGTDQLEEPEPRHSDRFQSWHMPSFFVDVAEFLEPPPKDLKKEGRPVPPRTPMQRAFDEFLSKNIEEHGQRFPSAAELYYLSTIVCPAPKPAAEEAAERPGCVLPGRNQTVIAGVHSGLWEWTTTRPGGPFSGVVYASTMGDFTNLRMIAGGDRSSASDSTLTATGLQWHSENSVSARKIGARGVRSAKPRRKAEDFLRPLDKE